MATACLRLGSSAGPAIIGTLVAAGHLSSVFLVFSATCAVALVFALKMVETRGRSLEEIAP
jgi:putative MFS transporter